MTIEKLNSFPPNSNPFHHDAYHMGTQVASNCTIMMSTHSNQEASYVIVINTKTGERIKVIF